MADIGQEFQQDNKTKVYNILKEKGFSPEVIAGIMGNISVETGKSFDYTQKQYEGGPGRGLFQMEGGMLEAYNKYLKTNNKVDSQDTQIEFVNTLLDSGNVYDIGTGHRNKLKQAFSNNEPSVIAREFSNRFLRPGKPNLDTRINESQKILEEFKVNQ